MPILFCYAHELEFWSLIKTENLTHSELISKKKQQPCYNTRHTLSACLPIYNRETNFMIPDTLWT